MTILEVVALYSPQIGRNVRHHERARGRQHSNSAWSRRGKVFLRATLSMADVHQQVFSASRRHFWRWRRPEAEPAYAVWAHLHLLVTRPPLRRRFQIFLLPRQRSPAVKRLKIEMLTAVADVSNTYDIVTELSEYVTDVDAAIAKSVRAVGRVALDGDQSVAGIVERLLQFVDHGADYVTAETLIAVKDLTQISPMGGRVRDGGERHRVETIVEPAAKAALVYLYGEYGQAMPRRRTCWNRCWKDSRRKSPRTFGSSYSPRR